MSDEPIKRGPGRPKGSKNRNGSNGHRAGIPLRKSQTKRRDFKIQETAEYVARKLEENSVVPFTGDAHEYLMSIYKNTEIPMPFRLDAAKACIPYEKPRLAAIMHKNADDLPPLVEAIEYTIVDPLEQSAEDVGHEFEQQSRQLEYSPYTNGEAEHHSAQSESKHSEPDHPLETRDTTQTTTFVGII